jgi:hypothetical protein
MALVVPNEGERRLLEYIVNKTPTTNLVLHLYVNSVNLSLENFTASSFTEATAGGYASATLAGSNWTASTAGSGVSSAVYNSSITFTFSTGQSVYGYYVTDTSGQILWAEEFSGAPFNLPVGGGEISVRPQVQLN